jgi:adenine phosphoribosyltransferase
MMNLREYVRIIEDYPKKEISFKDITTLAQEGKAFHYAINSISDFLKDKNIDLIIGPEARGFLIGAPVAYSLGIGFIPVRKKGKLPSETVQVEYELEYGVDILEIHKDAIKSKRRVAIVDDLLATGGTIEAVVKLVETVGGEVAALAFVIELTDLKGKEKLKDYEMISLVKYSK